MGKAFCYGVISGKKNSMYKGLKAKGFKIHLETQKFGLAIA